MSALFMVGGWAKLSTCDFPSRLASTVFAQGCPWECLYCHNPDLIDPKKAGEIEWASVLNFMKSRVGLLDAMVFSGGEPTRQPALVNAARDIKDLGFEVGIHTSGIYPSRIQSLVNEGVVDWVGLDIKTALNRYQPVVQAVVSPDKILRSWDLLRDAGVDMEIRTTLHPSYMTPEDVDSILDLLVSRNVTEWIIQKVRSEGSVREWRWDDDTLVTYCEQEAQKKGVHVSVRG